MELNGQTNCRSYTGMLIAGSQKIPAGTCPKDKYRRSALLTEDEENSATIPERAECMLHGSSTLHDQGCEFICYVSEKSFKGSYALDIN